MTRRLIAAALAAALTLGGGAATPARAAEGEQILGLLLGLGTLYAIGRALEDSQASAASRAPVLPETIRPGPSFRHDPATTWLRSRPEDCLARFDTRQGTLRGYGAECLARADVRVDRLPRNCAIRAHIGNRPRTIYAARCLELEGIDLAQGRWEAPRHPPKWRGGRHMAD